jgi:hypothetical protein
MRLHWQIKQIFFKICSESGIAPVGRNVLGRLSGYAESGDLCSRPLP